jgi:hypothetical protein
VKIVAQTSSARGSLGLCACLIVVLCGLSLEGLAQDSSGQILCQITRNGAVARGTVILQRDGREVAHGPCNSALTAAPGRYRAVVRLYGNLDNPQKALNVEIKAGRRVPIEVDFPSGSLLVRVVTKGGTGPALIAVHRGGERIGTLSNGVEAQLSEGKYEIVVEQSERKKSQPVDLRAGQNRMIRVEI